MKSLFVIIVFIILFFFPTQRLLAQSDQRVANGGTTTPVIFPDGDCLYKWVNSDPSIGLPASGTGNILPFTAVNTGSSPVTATITATPSVSFAYVSATSPPKSFISVINVNTKIVTATIPSIYSAEYMEVNHAGTTVYASTEGQQLIYVINVATNLITATIRVSGDPGFMVLSPDDSKLYVADNYYLTVINTKDNSVIAQIPNFSAAGITLSPDGSKLYMTIGNTSDIYIINTTNYTTIAHFKAGYNAYSGFKPALCHDGSKLYLIDDANNNITVVSTVNYTTLATIPLNGFPGAIILNNDDSRLYVINYQNRNNEGQAISVINMATNQIMSTIPCDFNPSGISITPDGSELYVATSINATVINTSTNVIERKITGLGQPFEFGNFITSYLSCGGGAPVKFTITVEPSPFITASTATGSVSACQGKVSADPSIQQFIVSGVNLTSDITATAPAGFELSVNNTDGYSSSLTIKQSVGTIKNTIIYVRSSASAPAGNISGNVILSSMGATSQSVTVSGIINPEPVVNTPASQKLLNGSATALVHFTGTADTYIWINNTPAIGLAASGTGDIASFNVANNTVGYVKATITVTPVNSTGCEGEPVKFYITATDTATLNAANIPNTFTPNGDGRNDSWEIKSLSYFPKSTVNIFNRWGQKLFFSTGYPIPWDGKYKGKILPSGTYYYIIDPKNGQATISGWVSIVR